MAVTMVVEDGTGKSDANSYNTLAKIVTILEEYSFAMGLSAANTPVLGDISDASAISAARYIDSRFYASLMGLRLTDDQALEFPRVDVPKDAAKQYYYDSDVLPPPLLAAHAMATYWAENDTDNFLVNQDAPGTIKRKKEKVGPLEEDTEWSGGSSVQKVYSLINTEMRKLTDFSNRVGRA